MKITIIADTHFSEPLSYASVNEDGYNTRFIDQLSVFELVPKDTELLIHVGDIFNSKFRIPFKVLNMVFQKFKEAPGEKIIVCGNHDFYDYHRTLTLAPFEEIATIVNMRYKYIDIEDIRLHCIPYPILPNTLIEDIDFASNNLSNNMNILLSHIGIEGAEVGADNYLLKGDIYPSELKAPCFNYVFLGHYHKHQKFLTNAWYVGSPIQMTLGEREEQKGIMTLDTDTGKVGFIENTVAPKFYKYEVSSVKQLSKLQLNETDFYKIVLNCRVSQDRLNSISLGRNIVFEGGVAKKREIRLDNKKDPLKEYMKICGTNDKKLLELGRTYL